MKVKELGEFGLIEHLARIVARKGARSEAWQRLLLGIGDDAAAWQDDSSIQLATTDTLVQGVHFTLDTARWEELGWKALAVNLSDIAAMGGAPRYALVTLAVPGELDVENLTDLYKGMAKIANEFGVAVVGGDVVSSPQVVLTLAVFGNIPEGSEPLTRSAARVGDKVAVTGYLGNSAAGLKMLKEKLKLSARDASFFRKAHLRPRPRVAEGQALLRQGVKAAIDISDGLVSDMGQVCKASKVAARLRVDRVPLHPKLREAFPEDCLKLALSGGEDYELLFTAGVEVIERVRREISCPITVIGEIIQGEAGQVTLVDEKERVFSYGNKGWDHFLSRPSG